MPAVTDVETHDRAMKGRLNCVLSPSTTPARRDDVVDTVVTRRSHDTVTGYETAATWCKTRCTRARALRLSPPMNSKTSPLERRCAARARTNERTSERAGAQLPSHPRILRDVRAAGLFTRYIPPVVVVLSNAVLDSPIRQAQLRAICEIACATTANFSARGRRIAHNGSAARRANRSPLIRARDRDRERI